MISRKSGYGLVVERVLAKDEIGVRFSLAALNLSHLENRKPDPEPREGEAGSRPRPAGREL